MEIYMSALRFVSDFLAFSDEKATNDPKDQTKIQSATEESSFKSLLRQKITVATATTDQVIPLPEVNSEYLLIYTDREVTVKLDGSGDSRTLKPKAAGTKTLVLMERGDISTLTMSNASGSDANVDIISVKL